MGLRALALGSLLAVMLSGAAAARSPTVGPSAEPAPTPRAPTCDERFPADGPAGVDLRAGCVVSELIGYVSGVVEDSRQPRRLSEYLISAGVLAGILVAIGLAARTIRRAAGRRLATAAPRSVWSCPACRSLNDAGRERCYRCGRAFEPGAIELRTDAEAPGGQSFGQRRDRT